VTISVTVYVPGVAYRCEVVAPLLVELSPKFQSYLTIVRPVAAVDWLPMKLNVVVAGPVGGETVIWATGLPVPTVML